MRGLNRDLIRDYRLEHALDCDRAKDFGLIELAQELAALPCPSDNASDAEWQVIAEKLRALMMRHRDIRHEWNLTEMQEARLADYVNATRLLEDCLELAFMPPEEKEAMLNSLYLPPAQGEGRQNA
jgi:hypothetical protein